MENVLWMLAIAGGPIILGCVLSYAMLNRRRLSPREEEARHRAIKNLYHTSEK